MGSVPYLGCKISLVSKSEIRYEGILYTIDTKESTVALAKVRSFGTEGRPTDRPVAPRDEIYEYIIFRASDIKDLHVCEAPKSQPVLSGLPNDPAIVQHSAPMAPCSLQYGQTYGHVCGIPPFQHLPSNLTHSHVQQSLFPNYASGSRSGASLQMSQRKNATIDAGVQVSSDISISTKEDGDKRSQNNLKQPLRESGQIRQTNPMQRGSFPNRRFQRTRGPRRGRGRGRNFFAQRNTETLKFDGEYDFELANAEFIELENKLSKVSEDTTAVDTLAGGDNEEDSIAYDREKSFFDNISCEASRVAKGIPRFDWRVERKLNVETFGVSLSANWLRRRRGRGGFRGRSGRGRGAATLNKAGGDTPTKAVTFGEQLVTVEIERPETPIDIPQTEEIPVIELVESKDVIWEETEASKEQWK